MLDIVPGDIYVGIIVTGTATSTALRHAPTPDAADRISNPFIKFIMQLIVKFPVFRIILDLPFDVGGPPDGLIGTAFPWSFPGECEVFWAGFDVCWEPDIVFADDEDSGFWDASVGGPKFVLN